MDTIRVHSLPVNGEDLWLAVLRQAGPGLSADLSRKVAGGARLEDLAVIGGDITLAALVPSWRRDLKPGQLAFEVTELRQLRAILRTARAPDDWQEQVAQPAPPGAVHALCIRAGGRADLQHLYFRRLESLRGTGRCIDLQEVQDEDLVDLLTMIAATARPELPMHPNLRAQAAELVRRDRAGAVRALMMAMAGAPEGDQWKA